MVVQIYPDLNNEVQIVPGCTDVACVSVSGGADRELNGRWENGYMDNFTCTPEWTSGYIEVSDSTYWPNYSGGSVAGNNLYIDGHLLTHADYEEEDEFEEEDYEDEEEDEGIAPGWWLLLLPLLPLVFLYREIEINSHKWSVKILSSLLVVVTYFACFDMETIEEILRIGL